MSSLRVNLILGLAVIALGALVYIGQVLKGGDHDDGQKTLEPFADLTEEDMGTIHLELLDNDPIRLELRGGQWWMTEPLAVPADTVHVRAFLEKLSRLRISALTETGERDLYFQQRPAARLTVAGREIVFGKNNPLDYQRYLEYEGAVYLAEDNILVLVKHSLFFADHNLWRHPAAPLAIKRGERIWRRDASDEWGQAALAWRHTRAIDVKRTGEDGLDAKAGSISALASGDHWIDYQIVETGPELILAQTELGLLYHLPSSLLENLTPRDPDD